MSVFHHRKTACVLLLSSLILFLCFSESYAKVSVTSIQQLNDPAFTVIVPDSGAGYHAVKKDLSRANIMYLEGQAAYDAVRMGKADAYAYDRIQMEIAIANGLTGVKILPGSIGDKVEIAVGISRASKFPGLKGKINQFISDIKTSGTFNEMYKRWVIDGNHTMPDINVPSSAKSRIRIGTAGIVMPYSYYEGDKLAGSDIEPGRRFASWLGAEVEFRVYDFGGLIAAAITGEIDCIISNLNVTAERAEKIDFSDTLFSTEIALMIKDDGSDYKPVMPSDDSVSSDIYAPLAGKRIGVVTGSTHPDITLKFVPTAKLAYFDTLTDTFTALMTGKVDAVCSSIPMARLVMSEGYSIEFFGEQLTHVECAPIFAKTESGRKLCSQFSEFLKAQWDNGTIHELDSIWFGKDESRKVIKDYSKLPASNGKLRMAADVSLIPFVYVKDNAVTGYDIDCAARFCEAYGYGLEIVPMSFTGIIPAVQSGKCDFGMGGMTRTDEREESVLFSYPNARTGNVFVVRKSDSSPTVTGRYTELDELNYKRIGVQTGTLSATLVAERIPNAKIEYFDALPDILIALKTGKVDALACTILAAKDMMNHNDDVIYLDEWLRISDLSPIFTKSERGQKLSKEYGEFVKSLWDDGTISELESIWLGKDESKKIVKDYSKLPASNGILKLAVDTSWPPLAYVRDNRVAGYDIDLAVRFCEAKGYGLEIVQTSVSGIVAAVQSGKCDLSQSMNFTEERAEVALFSPAPTIKSGNVIVVMKADSVATVSGINELSEKRIGVQTGTTNPLIAQQFVPSAILEYFENQTDIFTALKTGKVDAVCTDIPIARYVIAVDDSYVMLGEKLMEVEGAPAFPKTEAGRKLCDQFSKFIKSMWENGTLKEIDSIWYGKDESKRTVKDYSKLPAPNGILKMAVDLSCVPFAYMKDNKIIGYDVDCAIRFCEAYGYGLEIIPMSFGAIIPALQSGKCDFSASDITITKEREEQVLFAYPNIKSGVAFFVRKPELQTETESLQEENTHSLIDELKASFERTFIREDRWKLFTEGIINTMIITVLSVIFGTILGFIVYLSCRGGNIIANLITRFFVWLIQGMPMVVLLMILYYIIFGKVDIAGKWVAVIAFTLTFGSGFYGMLVSGVNALDKGQIEAAYALGFTDRRAFFTIILPQAALHFMPSFKAEVVALIKSTAIVGYIAVQDLTKMGDIVRSRTYEAFFPLIAVAVIYFILAGMLNIIAGMIHNRIRPEKRTKSDILRGIDVRK